MDLIDSDDLDNDLIEELQLQDLLIYANKLDINNNNLPVKNNQQRNKLVIANSELVLELGSILNTKVKY